MQTWDPQKFFISVGVIQCVQFAADTFIKAMFNEDLYSLEIGADGSGCRIRNANESGRFEITLLKSSPTNDLLNAQAYVDRATGQGVVSTQVKDGNGKAVAFGANSWLIKIPDLERGKELGSVTWIVETDKIRLVQGGVDNIPGLL